MKIWQAELLGLIVLIVAGAIIITADLPRVLLIPAVIVGGWIASRWNPKLYSDDDEAVPP